MKHLLRQASWAIALLALLTLAAAPLRPPADPPEPPVRRGPLPPNPTPTATAEPRLTLDDLLRRHPDLRAVLCREPTYALREGEFVLPIFMYHQFEGRAGLNVSAQDFEEQLALLSALRYSSLTFGELSEVLSGTQTLPPRAVVLTFDDGWQGQYEVAYPLLRRYGMRGTFFVLAHRTRGGGEMDWAALKDLAAHGMEIGSHTRTHPQFDETMSPGRMWSEIHDSRVILEGELGIPVVSFAYPYGISRGGAYGLVPRAGYAIAAGTGGSVRQHPRNRYYMNRIEVNRGTTLVDFATWLPWRAPELCAPPTPTPRPLRSPRIRAR